MIKIYELSRKTVFFMVTTERILIQHETEDVTLEAERERLTRPLLARAGILDINDLFNIVPVELRDRCGRYPNINYLELCPLIFELTSGVVRALDTSYYSYREPDESHYLYPVIRGGFINAIAETRFFRRLFDVHQLGLARYYPLPNPQSRGEHSIYLAVNMVRCLQSLCDKDRATLVQRLQSDFIQVGLYSPGMNDDDILNTACDLTVLAAMMHDMATPAGGDTFKYLMGLDEEQEIEWLMLSSEKYPKKREEFLKDVGREGIRREAY